MQKKASSQLPKPAAFGSINVVAVTGISAIDDSFRQLCTNELGDYPNVSVIMYGDIVGQTSIFSLSTDYASQVCEHIEPWPADQFGSFSTVTSHRRETARRKNARTRKQPTGNRRRPLKDFVEIKMEYLPPRKVYHLPPLKYPYRFELEKRLDTGEPVFRWIPPFLPADQSK